ncbi:hypothetical protein Droror1_Dr00002757 [Drosera rotundifolia]
MDEVLVFLPSHKAFLDAKAFCTLVEEHLEVNLDQIPTEVASEEEIPAEEKPVEETPVGEIPALVVAEE